jgi:hypothetical protein
MSQLNRREFFGVAAAGAVAASLPSVGMAVTTSADASLIAYKAVIEAGVIQAVEVIPVYSDDGKTIIARKYIYCGGRSIRTVKSITWPRKRQFSGT